MFRVKWLDSGITLLYHGKRVGTRGLRIRTVHGAGSLVTVVWSRINQKYEMLPAEFRHIYGSGNSMIHIPGRRVIVNISIRSIPTNSRPRGRIGAANGALWEFRTHLTARCARPVVAIYSRITLLCYRVECHQLIYIISAADVIIALLIRYGVADGSSAHRYPTCSFIYSLHLSFYAYKREERDGVEPCLRRSFDPTGDHRSFICIR